MLSESDTPSSDERRARIVAELVDALERGESDALPRACREHPDLTRDLRDAAETMASLRSLPGGPNDRCARVGPGSRIAHFRILEEIGRGGMGIVFRARDEHLGREVALKWLASPLLSKGRIEAEASALAKIRHPNIVPIYEIVEGEAGLPAFAMELVDGESLEKIVARAIASGCPQHEGFALLPLGSDTPATPASYERSAASLIAKVADALEHAHQKQLIHRDVKPANILVDRRGEPHLIDFGLVRDLELASSARAGRGPGTAQYMAPEQIDGRGTPIDARTDVFSLGVTLYETLALRRAFSGETTGEIDHKILERDPPALRQLRPGVARDLETICAKAMEKEPARRYASAGELRDDLIAYLEDRPIAARRAGAGARIAKWAKRNPWPAGMAAAAAASCLLAFVGLLRGRHTEALQIQQFVAELRQTALKKLRVRIEGLRGDRNLYNWVEEASKHRKLDGGEASVLLEYENREAETKRLIPELHRQLSDALVKLEPRLRDTPAVAELKTDYDFVRWLEATFAKNEMMRREIADLVESDLRAWRAALPGGDFDALDRFEEKSDRLPSILRDQATITIDVDPPLAVVTLYRYHQQSQVKPGGDSRLVPVLLHPHREPNYPPFLAPGATRQPKFYPGDPALYLEEPPEGSPLRDVDVPFGAPIVDLNGHPVAQAVFVRAVDPKGAAAKVGIRPWDVLARVGGSPVTDRGNSVGYLASVAAGSPYIATFLRGSHATELKLVRGEGLEDDAGVELARADRMLDVPLPGEGLAARFALPDGSFKDTKFPGGAPLGCEGLVSASGTSPDVNARLPCRFEDYPIPTGKYLCVVACAGYATIRIPFEAWGGSRMVIREALLRRDEVPPGFVPVPACEYFFGGDPGVQRPEPLTKRRVEGFWISRFEVSTAEYEEFLNDPQTLASVETRPCRVSRPESVPINLVPRTSSNDGIVTPLWKLEAGRFVPAWDRRLPIHFISWNDAIQYCGWLTKKMESRAAGWTFDLPTSDEWECAARGADARKYTWGNEFNWHFLGNREPQSWPFGRPMPIGTAIFDESPFGVRDMAGSVLEWTSSADPDGKAGRVYRGGYFEAGEDQIQYFRSASHALGQIERPGYHDGFRVVARRAPR
jgi:formylglycine-generating enzyme required for sulfatase activity